LGVNKNGIELALATVIFTLAALYGIAWWTKPTCRDGYVPRVSIFGWSCVPGYKP